MPCVLPVPARPAEDGCAFVDAPLDGSLTLPELYDWHAAHNAQFPLFVYRDRTGGRVHLSYTQVVSASHGAGRRLLEAVGVDPTLSSSEEIGPVAILARTDIVAYVCVVIGLLRAGATVVPIATTNSPQGVAHLLAATRATHVLATDDRPTQTLLAAATASAAWPNGAPLTELRMPTYDELFSKQQPQEPLPPRTYDLHRAAIVPHSSGSSALPKPVPWTHASLLQIANTARFGALDLRGEVFGIQGSSMAHAGGLTHICYVVAGGYTAAVSPPGPPYVAPTPESVLASYRDCGVTVVKCVPSYLEAWARSESDVQYLTRLKGVAYGGGPLRKDVGDFLVSKGVPVCALYGMTEAGPIIGPFFPDVLGADWQYVRVNPQCNARFVPAGPDACELVIVKSETQALPLVNTSLDGAEAYATNDLLVEHPTKKGFWRVLGRADDQITLSNGLKTNPGPIENALCQDPCIQQAIVFGRARTHLGILVFPVNELCASESPSHIRDRIWPSVSRINQTSPKHSQIFKEMILIASAEKPMLLTEKGTLKRGATLAQYDDAVATLYESAAATASVAAPAEWSADNTLTFVRAVVRNVLPTVSSDAADIFDEGATSLHALWIGNAIVRALRLPAATVPLNFVYRHPSIDALAAFVHQLTLRGSGAAPDADTAQRVAAMRKLAEQFSYPADERRGVAGASQTEPAQGTDDGAVVVVTGTTGALSSSVLAALVASPDVVRVYALNRRAADRTSLAERQQAALLRRRLSTDIATSPKVTLCEAALEDARLGLPEELYEEIRRSVTHIFHIAWPVNFNMPLEAFAPALAGVRALTDLVRASPRATPPRLVFTSSIGVFKHVAAPAATVPEEPLLDPATAVGTGYSESKWVAEAILASARQWSAPLVARVGQLAGGLGGNWDTKEWFPALVASSVALGALPDIRGPAAWLPLDVAAAALVECRDAPHAVVHVVHPRPVRLEFIVRALSTVLGLPVRPYAQWLGALEARVPHENAHAGGNAGGTRGAEVPALRLLDFFRAMKGQWVEGAGPVLGCERAVESSESLRHVAMIGSEEVLGWVQYWRSIGFI